MGAMAGGDSEEAGTPFIAAERVAEGEAAEAKESHEGVNLSGGNPIGGGGGEDAEESCDDAKDEGRSPARRGLVGGRSRVVVQRRHGGGGFRRREDSLRESERREGGVNLGARGRRKRAFGVVFSHAATERAIHLKSCPRERRRGEVTYALAMVVPWVARSMTRVRRRQ